MAGRPAGDPTRVHLELPDHFDYGNTVPLAFEVDSLMTEADHVQRVDLFADGDPFPEVATFHFTPQSGRAHAATRIRLNEGRPTVIAVATLGDGSVCITRQSIGIAIGGCSAEAGVAVPYPMPTPEPRLEVPAEAGRDQIVEIQTMISHWMETGLRTDLTGKPIPRRIINRMECASADGLVFAADLAPAIAANAYLSFDMVARSSGVLEFTWREDGGAIYRATRPLLAV